MISALTHCMLDNFAIFFLTYADFFSKSTFSKKFRHTIRVSNGVDPDQARRFVGLDLSPNCLQKLSANNTSMQRVLEQFSTLYLPSATSI